MVQDLPGVLGHFQVDAEGQFSSPLVPDQASDLPGLGLSNEEYAERARLASKLQRILTEDQLVDGRRSEGEERESRVDNAAFFDELGQARRQNRALGDEKDEMAPAELREAAAPPAKAKAYGTVQELKLDDALQKKSERFEFESDAEEAPAVSAPSEQQAARDERARRVEQSVLPESIEVSSEEPPRLAAEADADISLDSLSAEPQYRAVDGAADDAVDRSADGPRTGARDDPADEPAFGAAVSGEVEGLKREVVIRTFESEVEPLELAAIESGELLLYRKVWREGARFVQGMVIDRDVFLDRAIMGPFSSTTLSGMSDLVVALDDDVIGLAQAEGGPSYPEHVSGMEGDLLYRARLTSPLDAIELIYSVRRLPAGPGGAVLAWTTVLLAAVFGVGFIALYRLGLGQIRLARQQQDFVSSVSHELKTPLTSIRMYSEMLKEGWADEARQQQYYAFIHDESERLSRLIANVLQLASITRGEPALELKTVRVDRLLDNIRSKIATQVERAGFEVGFSVASQAAEAMVEVDEDCMSQIIINLVDNALKFSRNAETRRVEIGATIAAEDRVRITVRDYGPGIPREQMKKIFRLFYRPQSELTRETVGTGIGLAIVHQLTQAMGGTVDVLNRDPGAEFGVSFPRG